MSESARFTPSLGGPGLRASQGGNVAALRAAFRRRLFDPLSDPLAGHPGGAGGPGPVVAPGAHDALSARLAAGAGAEALYMTGFGVAGSLLGAPDIGLVTATEMADRVRAMAMAAGPVPLIADGDNGHGGPANVARLVRLYEGAGAACVQIEDQVLPKRCGHMAGKDVVPRAEAVARVRAAVGARASADFLVMARTDARGPLGLPEALARGEAFLAAGADLLFVEAPRSPAEMAEIARAFPGVPLVANLVEDGQTPWAPPAELGEMGYRLVLYPVSGLLAAAAALARVYEDVVARGIPPAGPRLSFADYNDRLGLADYLARDADLSGGAPQGDEGGPESP